MNDDINREFHAADAPGSSGGATRLMEELVQLGVALSLENGQLRISAARGVITATLQGRLVAHKAELVERLRGASSATAEASALIKPQPQDDFLPFPLSDLQLGFYVANDEHMEYHVRPHAYLETDGGALDVASYEEAWNAALHRHRRAICIVGEDMSLQTLAEIAPLRCEVQDLRDLPADQVQARLMAVREAMMRQELPLDAWPWVDLRVSLWRDESGERSRIHYNHNNYFIDGFGTSLLMAEIARRRADPTFDPPPPALSYRDAMLGLERLATSPRGLASRQYWLDRLADMPLPPDIPQKSGMNRRVRSRLERREGRLDKSRWDAFKANAGRHGLTPSNAILTAYACVVARWSGRDDFILSQMVTRRFTELHPDITALMGNFASLYPLEVRLASVRFVDNVRAMQAQVAQDMKHLAFGGMQVMQQLNRLKGSFGSAPSPFVFGSGLFIKGYRKADFCVLETSQTLLDHQIFELDDGSYYYVWDLLEEFFPAGLIDAMWAGFEGLLHTLADDEGAWLAETQMALPAADAAVRARRNLTRVSLSGRRLHDGLRAQAASRPRAPVLLTSAGELAYEDLDRWSDAIAARLVGAGVVPGDRVGVALDRTPMLMAAVFGVLKAGAAYVPLDPAMPPDRLALVLNDIGGGVAVVDDPSMLGAAWPAAVAPLQVPAFDRDAVADWAEPAGADTDLAYLIYTSGSTGRPKGVMIDHRGAVNTIDDINRRFDVGAGDRLFGISAFNFDLSVYDLFGTAAAGATLIYPDPVDALDPAHCLDWLERAQVTVWNSVPALMSLVVEAAQARGVVLPALRLVMLSGDKIPLELPAAIRAVAPAAQLVSLGGATEASIWSIVYPFETVDPQWRTVPYGYPLDNQTWDVVDRHGRPCPTWVPGELLIGGTGLALGYWNDPEKTARSFILDSVSGERRYRTGDLGRYLPDGCLEWLGRTDFQVKIHGHRIELGEIEAALSAHADILQVAVTVQQLSDDTRRLVAHICIAPGRSPQPNALEAFLARTLPAYMVPTAWRFIESMPLTANGKVDRKSLSEAPVGQATSPGAARVHVAPETALERRLQSLWQRVLRSEQPIGIDDDFFEIGGQSFDAIRIFAAIKAEFGRSFTLGHLWRTRTIRAFCAAMAGSASHEVLVVINAISDGAPLCLVHPAGGAVTGYSALARLLHRPVVGLQATPIDAGAAPLTIEGLAEVYVQELRRARPVGPYALGGWSSGAMIAFAMAAKLEAAGESVSELYLLDGPAPQALADLSDECLLGWFIEDLNLGLPLDRLKGRHFAGMTLRDQLQAAAAAFGADSIGFDLRELESALAIFREIVVAGTHYRPATVRVVPTVVRVTSDVVDEFSLHPARDRADWGWGEFASAGVRCLRVAGTHHTFLADPQVQNWCAALELGRPSPSPAPSDAPGVVSAVQA